MSQKNKFNFSVPFSRVYKSQDANGKEELHVVAIASDTLRDLHGERITQKGIESLVNSVKKGIVNGVAVRGAIDNHHSTFTFADIYDGNMIESKEFPGNQEFLVDLRLKNHYPQSLDLYESVEKGDDKYQLSIGGYINLDNPEAISFSKEEDGTIVREMNDILLDHIMVTAKDHAANPRTRFLQAIAKSLPEKPTQLLKTNYKTLPDRYDGHIHILNSSSLDSNGTGTTEFSVGSHPRSVSHTHKVINYIVQDHEEEMIAGDQSEPSEEEIFWGSDWDDDNPGYRKNKFRSTHKSYDGIALMTVGKSVGLDWFVKNRIYKPSEKTSEMEKKMSMAQKAKKDIERLRDYLATKETLTEAETDTLIDHGEALDDLMATLGIDVEADPGDPVVAAEPSKETPAKPSPEPLTPPVAPEPDKTPAPSPTPPVSPPEPSNEPAPESTPAEKSSEKDSLILKELNAFKSMFTDMNKSLESVKTELQKTINDKFTEANKDISSLRNDIDTVSAAIVKMQNYSDKNDDYSGKEDDKESNLEDLDFLEIIQPSRNTSSGRKNR